MKKEIPFEVRRLLSPHRAIVCLEGLYRLQYMPSGRISEELVQGYLAKTACDTWNGLFTNNSIHSEQLVAISYEEIFKANVKLMKRREKFLKKKRKTGRKGGAA
jgi:hypothetical protein